MESGRFLYFLREKRPKMFGIKIGNCVLPQFAPQIKKSVCGRDSKKKEKFPTLRAAVQRHLHERESHKKMKSRLFITKRRDEVVKIS